MEAKKILETDWLDLLFENRNKEYGAYALRKNYSKRIFTAVGIVLLIAAASFSATLINFGGEKAVLDDVEVRDVVVQNIEEIKPPPPPPPKKEETPPPPPKAPEKPMPAPPKVQTTQFTPPVIKRDEEVKQQDFPPIGNLFFSLSIQPPLASLLPPTSHSHQTNTKPCWPVSFFPDCGQCPRFQ